MVTAAPSGRAPGMADGGPAWRLSQGPGHGHEPSPLGAAGSWPASLRGDHRGPSFPSIIPSNAYPSRNITNLFFRLYLIKFP